MKITMNNQAVPLETKYTECNVIGSTVIMNPVDVKKYLGSIELQKSTGIGIIKNGGTVNVVAIEHDDYTKCDWCLISYNQIYYYTPKEYIDTSNFVEVETLTTKTTSPPTKSLKSALAKEVSDNTESRLIQRHALYNSWNSTALIQVYVSKNGRPDVNYTVKEQPYKDAPDIDKELVKKRIKTSSIFPVQSLWYDSDNDQFYYGTTHFSPDGEISCQYILNDTVSKTNFIQRANDRFTQYWSMCYSAKPIAGYKLEDGSSPGGFKYPDLFHATFTADDGNFYQHTLMNGNMYALRPATMDGMSPFAHSADWFNSEYLGIIQNVDADTVGRALDTSRIFSYGTMSKRIRISDVDYFIDPNTYIPTGSSDPKNDTKYRTLKDVYLIKSDTQLITYNKINFGGSSYWLCSLQGDAYRHMWYIVKDHPDLNWVKIEYAYKQGDLPAYSEGEVNDTVITGWAESADSYVKGNTITTDETAASVNERSKESNKNKYVEPHYETKIKIDDQPWDIPGIKQGVDDAFIDTTEMWNAGVEDLHAAMRYELQEYAPLDTWNDSRHINRINRFRLMPTNSGLSTKSFIFMTRPDLNLFEEKDDVITGNMNPDLKRLPTFRYIAHLQNACQKIMGSLQYSTRIITNHTPWLSIITNQATGYSPIQREMDYSEIGETFHGNKVIYAEPTFKHKIAGTVDIPFRERRDLSLYYTLKMWIEYIQAVTLGRCSPRHVHIQDMELDYAVSLYFIQTDETMENILYWEKLTGVIPLTVPDNFFEWNEKNYAKDMEYTISFAYSFRAVQDEMTLCEINNLYSLSDRRTGGLAYYDSYNTSYDPNFDETMAKVADSFGTLGESNTPGAYKDEISKYVKNQSLMKKLYYSNKPDRLASYQGYDIQTVDKNDNINYKQAKFLPNYIPDIGMHGIPYVTGPFITRELDRTGDYKVNTEYIYGTPIDNGMYKLRWI